MAYEKLIRDPVHNYISIRDPRLVELIDCAEFQRLRRIRQLGTSSFTFPGAEHSRFAHALGVLHVAQRLMRRFQAQKILNVSEEDVFLVSATALLHDLGHGPFSHALESLWRQNHEQWTIQVITSDTEVGRALRKWDETYPQRMVELINNTSPTPAFAAVISSQLDVDRLDYLLRDSLMTGVKYGVYDIERIVNTLQPSADGRRVLVQAKGRFAVEEFLLARYAMYWQVYLHKTTRAQEGVLRKFVQRARDLYQETGSLEHVFPPLRCLFADDKPALEEFLALDDPDVLGWLKASEESTDGTLADLSRRFLRRQGFALLVDLQTVDGAGRVMEIMDHVRQWLQDQGLSSDYYCYNDDPKDIGYEYYTKPDTDAQPIWVLPDKTEPSDDDAQEISTLSPVIRALAESRRASFLFVPREHRDTLREQLRAKGWM